MNRSRSEILIRLALEIASTGVIVWYILMLNPSMRYKMAVWLQWIRWYAWSATTPAWMKEALKVRGYTGVD